MGRGHDGKAMNPWAGGGAMGRLDPGSPWISRALPQDFQGYQCGKPGMGADAAPHPLGGKQEANMTFPPPLDSAQG